MVALIANLLVLLSLTTPLTRHHPPGRHHPPPVVSMRVKAGYGEQFRDTAWTPVRVRLGNRTGGTVTGTVAIPDNANNSQGPPLPYHSQYELPVVLPPGVTKQVTLYVPGYDIQGEVDATFRSAGHRAVTASDYITGFGDEVISVGTFAGDPGMISWLNRVNQNTSLTVIHLNDSTLDPVPEVLSNFDVIVLSNVDASQLDRDQVSALQQYVRDGGALLLIGGPDWQETLHPLPAALIPGDLVGTRTVHNLRGLLPVGGTASSSVDGHTAVSVLTHPRGSVLASQDGIPLVVRDPIGSGVIEYLAFDPQLDPVSHWSGAGTMLESLIASAAPIAANRAAQPSFGPTAGPFGMPYGSAPDIGSELANLPSAALPSLVLFIILTGLYVVLVGPANFLLLRRLRRREFMWVTVPSLALLCVGSTFGIAFHLKGSTVELNTVGSLSLDGSGSHPATFYVGLFAPVRGDYHLTYDGQGLPSAIPQYNGYYPGAQGNPLGLRFQEGVRTGVTFVSMSMWSIRNVAIHTRVSVPGTIRAALTVDRSGDIVGTIHNNFRFPILRPVILAGTRIMHLADISALGTVHVRIHPGANVYANGNGKPLGVTLYGAPRGGAYYGGGYYGGSFGIPVIGASGVFLGRGGCCPGPPLPTEKTLLDRIRNVASALPESPQLATEGEVVFVGWTEQPFQSFTVDGASPQQRDLTMLSMPLSVRFPRGSFQLRSGTIGAQLVDDLPQQPVSSNACCGAGQPIYIGSGGWGIFDFDLPDHHVRFSRLNLWVNAGGAVGDNIGRVYDWRAHRWVHVDFSIGVASLKDPNRFVSPSGVIRLRLHADDNSGDITISNVSRDLQVTGQVVQG